MRRIRYGAALALALVAVPLWAQEPALVVEKNPSDPTGFVVAKFKMQKGDNVVWEVRPKPTQQRSYVEGEWAVIVLNGPEGTTFEVLADWINWDAKKRGRPYENVLIGKAPQPPPVPPGPTPPTPPVPPKPPEPMPVASFRAFVVSESGQTLTEKQFGVLYGSALEKALDAATTGDRTQFGWRRLDRDADPATLPAGLREAWAATKPKIGTVPAVAFVVNNGPPLVLPLPATGAEAAALVASYRGK